MNQTIFINYQPYSNENTFSATFHGFFTGAAIALHTWNKHHKQRKALSQLSARLLEDAGISESHRLAEINKPFWRS